MLAQCESAEAVTEEVLSDPARVKLISSYSKVLSEAELQWLTFETEGYAMYLAWYKVP